MIKKEGDGFNNFDLRNARVFWFSTKKTRGRKMKFKQKKKKSKTETVSYKFHYPSDLLEGGVSDKRVVENRAISYVTDDEFPLPNI